MLRNLKKKKKGFTLIELIIVIAIIAIISAIAIPKLLNSKDDANKKADIANAKTIANATATLLTNEELKLPTETALFVSDVVEVPESDAVEADYTNGNKVALGLQSIPTSKTDSAKKYFVRIGKDSSITVTIGDGGVAAAIAATAVEAYPNPGEALK